MKGIILAGGHGTRLNPLTLAVSKQLLPVYNKPMIYYPLSTLMLSGIKDILIISTERDLSSFKNLLGDGSDLGCSFSYVVQKEANGLAQAFILGEEFIGDDKVSLILGDNIFYSNRLPKLLRANKDFEGGLIFAYQVSDPTSYGVVEFDKNNNVVSIEEKPENPKSNFAIPGLYYFDNNVCEYAKSVSKSERGEYEITSLINKYLQINKLTVCVLDAGTAWLDTGTFDTLSRAGQFVEVIEKRQGVKIGCIEEIAYKMNYISKNQFEKISKKYQSSGYGRYLLDVLVKNEGI